MTKSDPFRRWVRSMRWTRGGAYVLCLTGVLLCGCPPVSDVVVPPSSGDTSRSVRTGYAAVVFINPSSQLVQNIISVEHKNVKPQVWVTPVTPQSWDALLVDFPFEKITIIGATPVNLQTGQAGEQVLYSDGAYVNRDRVTCGSVIVVRTTDDTGAPGKLSIVATTIPDSDSNDFVPSLRSAMTPGAASGLVVIRPEVPENVSAQTHFTWENGNGQVFSSTWAISGVGAGTAAVVECPVKRIGWGNLRDPGLPGATLENPALDLEAPFALRLGSPSGAIGPAGSPMFQCGDAVNLRLVRDGNSDQGFRLDVEVVSEGSAVPQGGIDLFGNIRRLLDAEGMAGRLSNTGLLLPTSPQ